MVNALTLIASVSLLAPIVNAYGMIGQVVDANNFCVFLPPKESKNRNIADTEWEGQAFCLGDTPKATKAGKLSSDFIKSAHYLATDAFVQVTGQIDPTKENLDPKDDGGQFDVKAPKGSSCAGWKFYVNLIEPVTKTFCMRCCNDSRTCNRGISEKGCFHIIPGDYTGPYGGVSDGYPDDSAAAASSGGGAVATKTTTTTTHKTTTTKKSTTTTTTKKSTTTTTTKKSTTTTTTENPTTTTTTTTTTTEKPTTTTTTTEKPTTTTTTTTTTTEVPVTTEAHVTTKVPVTTESHTTTQAHTTDDKSTTVKDANSSSGSSETNSKTVALGENDEASAQSVSGADSLKPTLGVIVSTVAVIFWMA